LSVLGTAGGVVVAGALSDGIGITLLSAGGEPAGFALPGVGSPGANGFAPPAGPGCAPSAGRAGSAVGEPPKGLFGVAPGAGVVPAGGSGIGSFCGCAGPRSPGSAPPWFIRSEGELDLPAPVSIGPAPPWPCGGSGISGIVDPAGVGTMGMPSDGYVCHSTGGIPLQAFTPHEL
jgi:hypothetical protein